MSNLTLRGNASGSGTFIVESPNSNNSRTLTLPDATTTLVGTDATQTLTNKTLQSCPVQGGVLTQAVSQTVSSGPNVEFLSIPSWARRITLAAVGLSITVDNPNLFCQLGTSSGFVTSGYTSSTLDVRGANTCGRRSDTSGAGFLSSVANISASDAIMAALDIINMTGNTWLIKGSAFFSANLVQTQILANITLGGVLDRVRLNVGTAFDAGTVNIMYEG